MSLITYLKENEIDDIEDDQEFMEVEYDAVRTYCEICGYVITTVDLEIVKSRGLEESFINWKEEAMYHGINMASHSSCIL